MARFNISQATFYRRFRESQSFGLSVEEVLSLLEAKGVFGATINDEENELPSILLLTSESMISKFHSNGKNVKFDLTYNLVREKTIKGQQYTVGVFLSVSNNLNIEPHCLVIMSEESKSNFVRVFTEFFALMKSPANTITTDEQKNIQLALNELKER